MEDVARDVILMVAGMEAYEPEAAIRSKRPVIELFISFIAGDLVKRDM
jgi:hypothetical protein